MKKLFPTFFDECARGRQIFVSAGRVGMQVGLNAGDILRVTGGAYALLTRCRA